MSKALSMDQVGGELHLAGSESLLDTPRILLAATDRWYPTARMGMALANAGCLVDAVCPAGHPLGMTRAVRQMYDYNGLFPLTSFVRAIRATNPDVVIPADDLATWHLHDLYDREQRNGQSGVEICRLIENSLGAPESFQVVRSRSAFMRAAEEEGIRVPHTEVIASKGNLLDWVARMGFPMVLKANGTSGGDGVRVVNTVEEAERAFRKLQAPPLLARAVKRAVADRDLTLVRPSLFRHRTIVNAQTFVPRPRGHQHDCLLGRRGTRHPSLRCCPKGGVDGARDGCAADRTPGNVRCGREDRPQAETLRDSWS